MGKENESLQQRGNKVFASTYARYPVAIVKGSGCTLEDADGKEYLDFLAGIAVCSLGHCHPEVTEAIRYQAGELVHVSNLYYTRPQTELAEKLVDLSFGEKVFFANSGAEANEAAIKMARIASGDNRYKIISLTGSFHGRTMATLSMTGQPKLQQGFEPMPEGFAHAPAGDLEKLEEMIDPSTCAVICEPIQGESGVVPLTNEYLQGVRELCDKHGLLLIFDEIQTGVGRTGKLFAYEHSGVVPDIMTLAKGLGSGLPIGAMLTTEAIASSFVAGTHGSTFGGNPVSCAAASTTLDIIQRPGFLEEVAEKAEYLHGALSDVAQQFTKLATGVRGVGLLQGLVLSADGVVHGADIVKEMFFRGYLINFAGNAALRFAPPLIVSKGEIDRVVGELKEVLGKYT